MPIDLPTTCACSSRFSVEHTLYCPIGDFPIIRSKEIKDLTTSVLTEVRHDVRVELDLQPIKNETMSAATANTSEGARLDIAMNGFWSGRFELLAFVCSIPTPSSNNNSTITSCMLHKTWKPEEKGIRSKDQRGGACNIYTSRFISYWWSIKAGNYFLQASGKSLTLQDQPTIQPNHELIKMPSIICSPPISNSMY